MAVHIETFPDAFMPSIPVIDIGPLFGSDVTARCAVDAAIGAAAREIGFMTVVGHPQELQVGPGERELMLRLFSIPQERQRSLWKRNFAPENALLYRGWFPLESSKARTREGFEFGPDIVRALPEDGSDDLLYEPTPLPDPSLVPGGWLDAVRAYYLGMEDIGNRILASLSRGLGIDERIFREAFDDGISTLRLLHYPRQGSLDDALDDPPGRLIEIDGKRVELVARAHVDSGLLTMVAQCGVAGLQARHADGRWIDVPPRDDGFAVNFGGLLERWTGGRVKATSHRVVGIGEQRFSVPFFFEPRPGTLIAPLPIDGVRPFTPFLYGDHLWATTTRFPENFGLGPLRKARAPYVDPIVN
jgi:isopenicillin N synthase-like dioxygenase